MEYMLLGGVESNGIRITHLHPLPNDDKISIQSRQSLNTLNISSNHFLVQQDSNDDKKMLHFCINDYAYGTYESGYLFSKTYNENHKAPIRYMSTYDTSTRIAYYEHLTIGGYIDYDFYNHCLNIMNKGYVDSCGSSMYGPAHWSDFGDTGKFIFQVNNKQDAIYMSTGIFSSSASDNAHKSKVQYTQTNEYIKLQIRRINEDNLVKPSMNTIYIGEDKIRLQCGYPKVQSYSPLSAEPHIHIAGPITFSDTAWGLNYKGDARHTLAYITNATADELNYMSTNTLQTIIITQKRLIDDLQTRLTTLENTLNRISSSL